MTEVAILTALGGILIGFVLGHAFARWERRL